MNPTVKMTQMSVTEVESSGGRAFVQCRMKRRGLSIASFELSVFADDSVWLGCVDLAALTALAKEAEMALSEFAQMTNDALTRSEPEYERTFVKKNTGAELLWKKKVSENSKFVLGKVKLEAESRSRAAELRSEFMSFCVGRMRELEDALRSENEDKDELKAQNKEAKETLDVAISAKSEFETKVMSQFAELLNSKKRKIEQLNRKIDELERKEVGDRNVGAAGSRGQPGADVARDLNFPTSDGEEASKWSASGGEDTDEEKEQIAVVRRESGKLKAKAVKPGASATGKELFVSKRKRGRKNKSDDEDDRCPSPTTPVSTKTSRSSGSNSSSLIEKLS